MNTWVQFCGIIQIPSCDDFNLCNFIWYLFQPHLILSLITKLSFVLSLSTLGSNIGEY